MTEKRRPVARAFGFLFTLLNRFRLVVINVVFFALLFGFFALMMSSNNVPVLSDGTALVVSPTGAVVEEIAGNPADAAVARMLGQDEPQTLLRDITTAIERAAEDDRITALVIDPSSMTAVSMNKLRVIREAIETFKESGKPVIAVGDNLGQSQYYLAATADKVYLNAAGSILMQGLGRYRTYYKDALDNIKADVRLIRVGTFKSAGEPYIRNNMSEAAKEANLEWLGDLWGLFVDDIAEMRGIDRQQVLDFTNELAAQLASANDDLARAALNAGLVDELLTRQEMRDRIVEVSSFDEDINSFRQAGIGRYLAATNLPKVGGKDGAEIAIVVASGTIMDGEQPPGTVGGESTSRRLREARYDDDVKAVVLRIDSPGGSAFASELIRREVVALQAAGKPVIASMSGVAASGGYWIAMDADKIIANPMTITGSIGIFGMYPSFAGSIGEVGLNVDGVGTTELAGALNPLRPIDENVVDIMQRIIENGYEEFITKVASGRDMSVEQVDSIAQGRVWSGVDALDNGLVDELGDFDDAIAAAAAAANLDEDFEVRYIKPKLTPFQQFIVDLSGSALAAVNIELSSPLGNILPANVRAQIMQDLQLLQNQKAGMSVNAYCFCELE